MKPYHLVGLLMVALLVGCSSNPTGGATNSQGQAPISTAVTSTQSNLGVVKVEIGYLGHPPVRRVLQDVENMLATYAGKVEVARYDFDTPEGAKFAEAKNLTGHTPLAIFVDGSMDFKVDNRDVQLYNFPASNGTFLMSGGNWTLDDLKRVLDQATGNRS